MLEIDVERAAELRAAGWTWNRIGAEFGCSGTTIRMRLTPAAAAAKKESTRKWREANPDYQRRIYAANAEIRREYSRRWHAAHKEAARESHRKWREANKDAIREYDRQRRKNSTDEPARSRARRLRSISQRFGSSASVAARRAARTGIAFEQVDLEALCERDGWICQICFAPVDRLIMTAHHPWGMSFDHVVPESAGGGWTRANLQLAHRGCNVMRGDVPLSEAREFARQFLARLAAQ